MNNLNTNNSSAWKNIINDMEKKAYEDMQSKEIELKINILTAAYDKSTAYTNFIILAGYAALFSIWANTKDFLPEKASIFIALFTSFSLFIFCAWEFYKMIRNSSLLKKQCQILEKKLQPKQFFEEMQQAEIDVKKSNVRMWYYWYFVITATALFGFGGAIILMYNFIANLLHLPYWPK